GAVVGVEKAWNGVLVALEEEVKVGDGVLLAGGDPEQPEPGGRVATILMEGRPVERAPRGSRVVLGFETRSTDASATPANAVAWRSGDPALERELRATFEGDAPRRHARLDLRVEGRPGTPLVVTARDDQGHEARAASETPLGEARSRPLDRELLA